MGKEPIVNRLVPMRRWTFSSFSFGSLLEPSSSMLVGHSSSAAICSCTKVVYGLSRLKRLDHVIAIPPCGDEKVVGLEPGRVGVAHQVQPVAAPTLAVARRSEQAIDQLFVGVGGLVVDELFHLLRRGRKSMEIEVGAPRKGAAVGFGREMQPLLLPASQE